MIRNQTDEIQGTGRKHRRDGYGSCWVIVMAAGMGQRMRAAIHRWMGESRPKQYCTFVGTRSMLQHTLDRASALTVPHRIVTVIGRNQHHYFEQAVETEYKGVLLTQPQDRGTAATVFHALAHIMEHDPDGTVVLFPSDHFVKPEETFLQIVKRACMSAGSGRESIVMLGAAASGAETDYGWIVPSEEALSTDGDDEGNALQRVMAFHEKPSRAKTEELCRQGGLWNTMVVASKARFLWAMGRQFVPEIVKAFESYREECRGANGTRMGLEDRMIHLAHLYARMRPADFSSEVLQRAVRWSVVLPMRGVEWSDWGRPERILKTLARMDLPGAFSRIPCAIHRQSDHSSSSDRDNRWIDLTEGMAGAHP